MKSPGQDVKISLYYAYSEDGGDNFTEMMVDEEAIDTAYLSNPKSLGDRIDIMERPANDPLEGVVIVYMGTRHPVIGFPGGFTQQQQTFTNQTDEAIYLRPINWITP